MQVDHCSGAKVDLLESIHGREIMSVLGLEKGKTLITGSEDTTFKVLNINGREINVA